MRYIYIHKSIYESIYIYLLRELLNTVNEMENNQKFKRNKNVSMSLSQTTWKVAHTSYCKHSGPNTSKAPSHLCCKTKRETVAFIVHAHTHRHTYRNYMRIKEIYIQQYALYTTQRSFYSTVWESLRSVAKTQTPAQRRTWHSNCVVRV